MAYPTALPSYSTKNNGDTIDASHVNGLQTDLVAVATYLGTNASQTAPVANRVLLSTSNGVSSWGQVDLTTAQVTGILTAANGGTGNGFTAFSGPATSTKTFTLPNANATILTSNAAVTIGQGGTGLTTIAAFRIYYASAADTLTTLAPNTTTTKKFLSMTGDGANGAAPTWATLVSGDLPSHTHAASDITSGTLATARGGFNADVSSIAKGGLVLGSGAGTFGILTVGSDGQILTADSASTNGVKWAAAAGGGLSTIWVNPQWAGGTSQGTAETADANFAAARYAEIDMNDGATSNAYFTFSVPSGKSISAIVLHWISGATGDVRLTLSLWYATHNEAITNASNVNSYTITATGANKINQTTINSAMFSGTAAADTIALQVSRIGADGADTMSSRMGVIGLEVTFS